MTMNISGQTLEMMLQGSCRMCSEADYTLVLGMPGTGKTATITSAIIALAAAGRSVLLTSYTNAAVDNVLLRLRVTGTPYVRLGRSGSVHPLLHAQMPGGEDYPDTSVTGLARIAKSVLVVSSIAYPVFNNSIVYTTYLPLPPHQMPI